MGFRHDIAKSLIAVIVSRCEDSQYRDITESNMADSTTFDTMHRKWASTPVEFVLVESARAFSVFKRYQRLQLEPRFQEQDQLRCCDRTLSSLGRK